MNDWTAALHQGAAMPSMQQDATIKPQQGGIKMSQPPKKVVAPPALKQPGPAVPFKPAKPVKKPAPAAAAPAGGKKAEVEKKMSHLAGEDRRWVDLESARFVTANRDTWDDSHELAVRAHNHAAAATSTFTRQRSAAVCEAFVRKVTSGPGHHFQSEIPGVPEHYEADQPQEFWDAYAQHREDGYHPPAAYARAFSQHGVAAPQHHSARRTASTTNFPDSLMFL
jgi:hypothetical protein